MRTRCHAPRAENNPTDAVNSAPCAVSALFYAHDHALDVSFHKTRARCRPAQRTSMLTVSEDDKHDCTRQEAVVSRLMHSITSVTKCMAMGNISQMMWAACGSSPRSCSKWTHAVMEEISARVESLPCDLTHMVLIPSTARPPSKIPGQKALFKPENDSREHIESTKCMTERGSAQFHATGRERG